MPDLVQLDLSMNGYLFGCTLLMALWFLVYAALMITGRREEVPEFWWTSLACSTLGITEPLFVPEYWDPPSVLKIDRWDLESFLFCFAVGGIAGVLTELPRIKAFFVWLYFAIERVIRSALRLIVVLTARRFEPRLLAHAPASRLRIADDSAKGRLENMILITFFLALFGATTHLGINVIYDAAFTCVGTAALIAWRRPDLRWQIVGGAITFMAIYTIVLVVMDVIYPDFYDYWNHPELSGIWLMGAPIEEFVFAFTFGLFWAPMYEVWKEVRT
jgi:hypothetical protein